MQHLNRSGLRGAQNAASPRAVATCPAALFRRAGAAGSALRVPRQTPAPSGCPIRGDAAALHATASDTPSFSGRRDPEPLGLPDLQALVRQIPFQKLAIWALVAGVAYQLQDFFGVRSPMNCRFVLCWMYLPPAYPC